MMRFLPYATRAPTDEPSVTTSRDSSAFGARLTDRILGAERDRWFLWTAPLFALGIAIYFALLAEPGWVVSLTPAFTIAILRVVVRNNPIVSSLLTTALVVAAGFAVAKIRTETVRAPVLPMTLKSAELTGFLERAEHRPNGSVRLTILVHGIVNLPLEFTPKRVRVVVRKAPDRLTLGSAIQLRARLSPPPAPARPRGYDFARAAYFLGIGGIGYAFSPPTAVKIASSDAWYLKAIVSIQQLRRHIGSRIEAALPGETGVMANALMTGERSGISKQTNELYRDAGIFHILSISGLHMAIMGGSVFIALRFLFAAFPSIALRYPIKKWAAGAAAISTFAYLLISGGAHPTVRSFLMISIMFLAIMLDRPAIALRNVALAALFILMISPESLFNAGFQLSFAAVVALVACYEAYQAHARRKERQDSLAIQHRGAWRAVHNVWLFLVGTIATTIIAGSATAPFAAYHFHTSQQYSVLTNMLAIPVSNLMVMPAALAAFVAMPFGLEEGPLWMMGLGINLMTWAAQQVTSLPGAVTAVPAFPTLALQFMVAGGLWLSLWRRRWRLLGAIGIVAGVMIATTAEYPAVLIGRDGELLALRNGQHRLTAIRRSGAAYQFSRWLEADGDDRSPEVAWGRKPFRCDLEGCTARVGEHRIAHVRSPASLADDCRRATIVVISFPKPHRCQAPFVIGFRALRTSGAHAIYLGANGAMRVETVEQYRGHRPWTISTHQSQRRRLWKVQSSRNNKRGRKRSDRHSRTQASSTENTQSGASFRTDDDDGSPLYWYRR